MCKGCEYGICSECQESEEYLTLEQYFDGYEWADGRTTEQHTREELMQEFIRLHD